MLNNLNIIIQRLIKSKVIENYFFMTFLQGAGLIIGLILFPYVIRTLGEKVYGTYVYIFSHVQCFILLIGFGFSMPALKKISLNQNNNRIKNRIISEVFTAKLLLFVLCATILTVLTFLVPFVEKYKILYFIIFTTALADIFFPTWYFQGVQKMKFVTYVNLALRLLTVPLIFIFVKSPNDLLKYTFIVSICPIFGSVFTFFYLQIKENIKITFVAIKSLKSVFKGALPFFGTAAIGTIKKESLIFIIGTFINFESVAIYDLANKIILVPRMITNSVNAALFPNIMQKYSSEKIKKIMKTEFFISVFVILLIIALGYWAVLWLGGSKMLAAYPLSIILSFTIFTWLIVGCYCNFIFIKKKRNDLIFRCKLVELCLLFIFLFFAVTFFNTMFSLVAAVVLSELLETVYCYFITKKYKLI